MGPGPERDRIKGALEALARDGTVGADAVALAGRPGWVRVRVGDWRLLVRRRPPRGWWVERVVHRGELHEAVRGLPR